MKQFEDGDPCFAPMLNALFAAFRGTAVMSGCEVSATGTSRAVSITAGSVQIDGVEVAVGAGSVTLDAGGSFDRYDLVSVNASGSKIVTKGTTKRKCPTQPANTCLLAIVFVPAGATVIATGNVYDARMLASRLVAAAIRCSGEVAVGGTLAVGGNATFSAALWAQYGQLLAPPTQNAIFRVYQDNSTKCNFSSPGKVMKSVTVPSRYIEPGSVSVKFNHTGVGTAFIRLNGENVMSAPPGGVIENVKAGDVIDVYVSGNNEDQGCNSLFEIYALDVPISKGRPW